MDRIHGAFFQRMLEIRQGRVPLRRNRPQFGVDPPIYERARKQFDDVLRQGFYRWNSRRLRFVAGLVAVVVPLDGHVSYAGIGLRGEVGFLYAIEWSIAVHHQFEDMNRQGKTVGLPGERIQRRKRICIIGDLFLFNLVQKFGRDISVQADLAPVCLVPALVNDNMI
jgi:hypothetical protein